MFLSSDIVFVKPDGTWVYAANETRQDLQIWVPQPDDSMVEIVHLGVN